MAKDKKAPVVRRRRARQQEMSGFGPLMLIAISALALFNHHAAIITVVGIVPTIVLGFTGKGEYKAQRLQCVAFANLAGTMPFAGQAISRSLSWEMIIGDVINLVAMWGGAAIGYALIYVGPLVAAFILQAMNQDRLKKIAQQRQALIELWGSDVLGDKDEPKKPAPGPTRPN